jgi:hypothetical protein
MLKSQADICVHTLCILKEGYWLFPELSNGSFEPVQVAHICNPSYLGGRDQEDHSLRSALAKSSQDPISTNSGIYLSFQATWQIEIRRIKVLGQLGWKGVHETPSQQKTTGHDGTCLSSQLWRQA